VVRSGRFPIAIRLLVVDDHNVVRESIVKLLNADPEFEVVGEAGNGFDAVSMAQELKPDIVLMDLYLPGLDGIEAMRLIRRDLPSAAIAVLTASVEELDVVEAMQAGARGYILKSADVDGFLSQLREVAAGKVAISPEVTSKLVTGLSSRPATGHSAKPDTSAVLTAREKQVLDLVSRGLTNKQISEALSISENTARAHVRSLMQKLNLDNRTRLAIHGTREGLGEAGRRSVHHTGQRNG
ncbi:MAG: response regulator transcription factor, partial [Dehalococcoidia bacterium]